MASILDLLGNDMGKTIIDGVAKQTGQDSQQTQDLLTMALPVLTHAMKRNASSQQGADGLLNALNKKHNGSILDNLSDLFKGGVNDDVINDGDKILGHVLGNKKQPMEQAFSEKSGIDLQTVSQILKIAAPILMGYLGKQARNQPSAGSNNINDMLSGLVTGSSAKQELGFLSILDTDNDGSIIDDVSDMMLNANKKKSGLGGLLDSFLGKD